jgi:hypothetical protein
MLQQAAAIGRQGAVSHVKCLRYANELIIVLDNDPRYEWLLPAVYGRLSEELKKLKSDMGDADVQSVNLADKEKLHFLGFELRAATDRHGRLRVRCKQFAKGDEFEEEMLPAPKPACPPLEATELIIEDAVEEKKPPPAPEPQPGKVMTVSRRTVFVAATGMAAATGILIFLLMDPFEPELVPVEGKVTLPGKPYALAPCKYGRVWLQPDRGRGNKFPRTPMAELHQDGTFTVYTDGQPGAPPGWYRVAIMAADGRRQLLPPKYAEAETSGLSLHVDEDAEPGEFNLVLP